MITYRPVVGRLRIWKVGIVGLSSGSLVDETVSWIERESLWKVLDLLPVTRIRVVEGTGSEGKVIVVRENHCDDRKGVGRLKISIVGL